MAAGLTAAAGGGGGAEKRKSPSACALALWLAVAFALGQSEVAAVEVFSPAEFFVEIGTDAKLPCTFTSSAEISAATSVTWSFEPQGSNDPPQAFFYYSDRTEYPGKNTQFSGRSSWAGDISKKDASIKIANMQLADNGAYICDVKNPPDIVTTEKPIQVKVMKRGETPRTTPGNFTTTASGNISLKRVSFWLLVLQCCCILAPFPSYLL